MSGPYSYSWPRRPSGAIALPLDKPVVVEAGQRLAVTLKLEGGIPVSASARAIRG
jgi:hypothetical protein